MSCRAWGVPGRVASHFPAGEDSLEGCHFLFAAGTNGGGFGGGWFFRVKDQRDAGVEGEAFALEFGGGMAVAVAADGAQADGQDMAQVAGNKLNAGKGFGSLGVSMGAVFPRKGDRRFADSQNARVGDACAANIPAQILDDALAVAECELGVRVHFLSIFDTSVRTGGQGSFSFNF